MNARVTFFKWLTNITFCGLVLFSVKTFWEALPDHIYVKVGEAISYDFLVPVTVERKEDDMEAIFVEGRVKTQGKIEPSFYVTCKLFGIVPVKDIAVTLVEGEAVFAGGMPVGIYAKTKGVLVIGMGEVTDWAGVKRTPAKNMLKRVIILSV